MTSINKQYLHHHYIKHMAFLSKKENFLKLKQYVNEYKNTPEEKDANALLITECFRSAIWNNSLEAVKFLLTSPTLYECANIHYLNNFAIITSCKNGNLDMVKYLLTSPDLKEKANILAYNGMPFRGAVESNQLDVVEYLLENPEFNINPYALSDGDDSAFMFGCAMNALETIKYLTKIPGFDINKALSSRNSEGRDGFEKTCENHKKNTTLVHYFIFECNFKPNSRQEKYIQKNLNNPVVALASQLLEKIELNEKLKTSLEEKDIKSKVKI